MTRREIVIAVAGMGGWCGTVSAASAKPRQILILRHGEKSALKTDIDLNPRGYQRAAALPRLFPAQFDTPHFIVATHASKHSNRPIETVAPLAKSLRVKIDSTFGENDTRALARALLSKPDYAEKTILVCWHHEGIPRIATALGVPNVPSKWPDQQFDRVWKIQFEGDAATITDMPQHLLPGDS